MTRRAYCLIGLVASILIALSGELNALPAAWHPYVVLLGAVGSGISLWLHSSPLDKTPQEEPPDGV